MYYTNLEIPGGRMLAAARGDCLTGLWFRGQRYFPSIPTGWVESPEKPLWLDLRDWLKAYFAGQRPVSSFVLDPYGTPFQKQVWECLLQIPYGRTATYGQIARELGCPCARAVGQAIARNPISILIPCHRVMGVNGRLTGYAAGIERKQALLKLEEN